MRKKKELNKLYSTKINQDLLCCGNVKFKKLPLSIMQIFQG